MSEGKSQTLQGVKLGICCNFNFSQEPKLLSAIPVWDRYRTNYWKEKVIPKYLSTYIINEFAI